MISFTANIMLVVSGSSVTPEQYSSHVSWTLHACSAVVSTVQEVRTSVNITTPLQSASARLLKLRYNVGLTSARFSPEKHFVLRGFNESLAS